jgi:hypothetical protein
MPPSILITRHQQHQATGLSQAIDCFSNWSIVKLDVRAHGGRGNTYIRRGRERDERHSTSDKQLNASLHAQRTEKSLDMHQHGSCTSDPIVEGPVHGSNLDKSPKGYPGGRSCAESENFKTRKLKCSSSISTTEL